MVKAQNKEVHIDISSDLQIKRSSVTLCLAFSQICLAIQLYKKEMLDVYINYHYVSSNSMALKKIKNLFSHFCGFPEFDNIGYRLFQTWLGLIWTALF